MKLFRTQLSWEWKSTVNGYENANNSWHYHIYAETFSCSTMLSKKFAITSNWRFISRTDLMLSWVSHEKKLLQPRDPVCSFYLRWNGVFVMRFCIIQSLCLGGAAFHDYGLSWVSSSLTVLYSTQIITERFDLCHCNFVIICHIENIPV